jgi:hypothetical protein
MISWLKRGRPQTTKLASWDGLSKATESLPRGTPLLRVVASDYLTRLRSSRLFVNRSLSDKLPSAVLGLRLPAATHPDSAGMTKFYAHHNSPPSYANSAYFGIHTFKSIDTDGKATLVRWRFVPEDGEKGLTDADRDSIAFRGSSASATLRRRQRSRCQ